MTRFIILMRVRGLLKTKFLCMDHISSQFYLYEKKWVKTLKNNEDFEEHPSIFTHIHTYPHTHTNILVKIECLYVTLLRKIFRESLNMTVLDIQSESNIGTANLHEFNQNFIDKKERIYIFIFLLLQQNGDS